MKRTRDLPHSAGLEHRRLTHELEVHKIELEMQNQALREDRTELEESRTRYAELYELAPVGHVTLDHAGGIVELNLACATLLGKDRRKLYGKPLLPLLAPQSRGTFEAHVRACVEDGRPATAELMVPLAGGGFRVIELLSSPPPSTAEARSMTFHSVMTDITARKRDDARRDQLLLSEREARALAEATNRAKEDLLAIVSHELRTPLVPMMMWIKALRAGGMSDTLRSRAVEAIDACLEAEVAMIDDLVDLARGQHGKLRVQRRPLDLQPIVGAALETVAPSAAAKLIKLELDVDPGPAWVVGDAIRLRQVVGNLLSNAVKFTPEAGRIAVSLHTRGDEVTLVIRDDGEGIDGSLLGDIFEPFRQHGPGTARRHGGLGLGLAIVRQLVDQHQGRVTAESEGKGRGACFTVTLPRGQEVPSEAAPRGLPATSTAPLELTGIGVLVVEDHAATREALEVALQAQGAAVTTAVSAQDARAAIERRRPHIVVSDIGMPGEDGYAFIRKLRTHEARAKEPRLPAVALTAHTSDRDRQAALEAGFDRHVAKPIAFDRLVSMIGALVRGPTPTLQHSAKAATGS